MKIWGTNTWKKPCPGPDVTGPRDRKTREGCRIAISFFGLWWPRDRQVHSSVWFLTAARTGVTEWREMDIGEVCDSVWEMPRDSNETSVESPGEKLEATQNQFAQLNGQRR